MREVISNSNRALPFAGSAALRDRRSVPQGLAALHGRIRLDRFKRGTAPQTGFRQLISLLPLRLSPAEITDILQFYSDEQTLKTYYQFCEKDLCEFGPQSAPDP
jgi:hypothetical protein